MAERPNGKITDGCTTGKVFKVYKGWCKDNNHGFSKTAKEFRDILAENYDCPYAGAKVIHFIAHLHLQMRLRNITQRLMTMMEQSYFPHKW